jgi:hypothetical protein
MREPSLDEDQGSLKMSIVNCKVNFIRPQYNNLRDWMLDANNVYIGRAGIVFVTNPETGNMERFPKTGHVFQNPYIIGKHGTREEVLQKYNTYIQEKLNKNPELVKELLLLKNKNLGCWCYPEMCHGNILIELIQKYTLCKLDEIKL